MVFEINQDFPTQYEKGKIDIGSASVFKINFVRIIFSKIERNTWYFVPQIEIISLVLLIYTFKKYQKKQIKNL